MASQTIKSVKELRQREREIAAYSLKELQEKTVLELRTLAGGLVPRSRSLRKQQLVNEIYQLGDIHRKEKLSDAIEYSKEYGEGAFGYHSFLQAFTDNKEPVEFAESYFKLCAEVLEHKESTLANSDAARLRTYIERLKDEGFDDSSVKDWSAKVYKAYRAKVAILKAKSNEEYKEVIENRTADDFLVVDGGAVIDWCEQVVKKAIEKVDNSRGYPQLALALAATSGRRMDEIFGTTQYELVSDTQVKAIGLSKKDSGNAELIFTPLIDAPLWFEGMKVMPESRRNLPNAKVNNTVRKTVKESTVNNLKQLGFNTFKNTRDFYICYNLDHNYNRAKHASESQFARDLVGHQSTKIALSYNKILTKLDD